ncbi:MAG TPA: hydrogenase nickel incorporation protein HypB [Candidatus Binatia bacterium]|nr:hydrogenase nickel incorporation protein HypB [Candidatus Binatia bacterium]
MCATCGCSDHQHAPEGHTHSHSHDHDHARLHDPDAGPGHDLDHLPGHEDGHGHHHDDRDARARGVIQLERDVLARNALLAERNRGWFLGRGILALNLVSSPGAGKTALLERTIRDLGATLPILVIEGDQATARDAERIRAAGARALQITTGTVCHLDAAMVARALRELDPPPGSVVMIENVGNLVCPALFDLGEHGKVVIVSVPEGDDKPIKYPHMFRASDVMVLNKIDLLPHVRFDVARCIAFARQVNPRLEVLEVSATRGDGLEAWYAWLRACRSGPGATGVARSG